ncbi:MAG: DUF418 domain-containing protein [Xanthomonadales bacterium]|mgnify:CR=1 FL=1|nr:DUF418 domain-containing protein [Xanthomonadales bacterium]HRF83728.1 DUF418 domain-containing protein [Pseudoxanthomonas sp.]
MTGDPPQAVARGGSGPVERGERLPVLDVLRGVAIFGILVGNMVVFSGYGFLSPAERAALPTPAGDAVAMFLIHVLVDGKFYSLFSLLFGFGFAVQMRRAQAQGGDFPRLFRRRLLGLFLIGLLHAVFVWSGDILMLYAMLGLLLLPLRQLDDRTLLRAVAACLLLPSLAYLGMLAAGVGNPFAPPVDPAAAAEGPDLFALMLAGFRGDSWAGAWRSNLIQLAGRWVDLFLSVRFPKVLAMFLLGFWLGRRGIGIDPVRDRPLLRRTVAIGLLVGIPANTAMAWLMGRGVYLPASLPGLAQVAAATVGIPLLTLAYAAAVVLAFHAPASRRPMSCFAPPGRMALSNYLMHSVVMTWVFYGWGLGWYGRIGPALTTPLALLTCVAQIGLSAVWLSRFRFGPVEWLWRSFTYRRKVPLRRAGADNRT